MANDVEPTKILMPGQDPAVKNACVFEVLKVANGQALVRVTVYADDSKLPIYDQSLKVAAGNKITIPFGFARPN